ncbi:MAG: AAA family ATPase [Deltaproteobacteria bacterium]|nr:AAA family ATPase [Deltaproteobacteria bacterium]
MPADRITKIRISNLRVFKDVELTLDGLTVLIGDNGSGKSTLLECLELLRHVGIANSFAMEALQESHGPFVDLLRRGASSLSLGVDIEGDGPPLSYGFKVSLTGTVPEIVAEMLFAKGEKPRVVLKRGQGEFYWFDESSQANVPITQVPAQMLAAAAGAQGLSPNPAFVRLAKALRAIEYHPPFEVRPIWQQLQLDRRQGPRWPSPANHTERLKRYGHEFPAALLVLRNDLQAWQRFLERARAALGPQLTQFSIQPAGSGQLDVLVHFGLSLTLPLRALSEGQLSFLLMLAAVELGRGRSVLAFDEPDIHYHPELVVNLVHILEDAAQTVPVVVATHSDRFLDALSSPSRSVVVTHMQDDGSVSLMRLKPEQLGAWLERYRGLGSIRAEGYLPHVI